MGTNPIKLVITLGCASALIISAPLWFDDHPFPRAPLIDLPGRPALLSWIWYLSILLWLALVVARPRMRIAIPAFLLTTAPLILWDQARICPWLYQYWWMLLTLWLLDNRTDPSWRSAHYLTLQLSIVSVYLWSGISKINLSFVTGLFPWIIEPAVNTFPALIPVFALLSIATPFIEATLALALISNRFRRFAVISLITMHLLILLALGPLGRNWNPVIWPWNIVMCLLLITLFWRRPLTRSDLSKLLRHPSALIITAVFLILPALNRFGYWDSYPSFALYSGDTVIGELTLPSDLVPNLPSEAIPFVPQPSPPMATLDLLAWSLNTLGVPPYPEVRVIKAIGRSLCHTLQNDERIVMKIKDRPPVTRTDTKVYTLHCSEI